MSDLHAATDSTHAHGSDHPANGASERGSGKPAKRYKINVDGRQLETLEAHLTGLQIKVLAGVEAAFALFLEQHGQNPDRQIADNDLIDLEQHGREAFYTAPPANYGGAGRGVG